MTVQVNKTVKQVTVTKGTQKRGNDWEISYLTNVILYFIF